MGRILREYGEESNWRRIQSKIVEARLHGGLHSTSELVNLVRCMSPMSKGRLPSRYSYVCILPC